jgi:hypothetical protein
MKKDWGKIAAKGENHVDFRWILLASINFTRSDTEYTRIKISMDGKGCWRDNVFVEQLWRTIKYEHVYLYAYGSMNEAKERWKVYLEF